LFFTKLFYLLLILRGLGIAGQGEARGGKGWQGEAKGGKECRGQEFGKNGRKN